MKYPLILYIRIRLLNCGEVSSISFNGREKKVSIRRNRLSEIRRPVLYITCYKIRFSRMWLGSDFRKGYSHWKLEIPVKYTD